MTLVLSHIYTAAGVLKKKKNNQSFDFREINKLLYIGSTKSDKVYTTTFLLY